jgi:ATP-dependent DNA helicase PIF1
MVHLVSSNRKAQTINKYHLDNIKDESVIYTSVYTEEGDKEVTSDLKKELYSQLEQKGLNSMILKKGARVMLMKNLKVEEGLVNGAVGTIVDFEKTVEGKVPVVKFDNGLQTPIGFSTWELELGENVCKVVQVPLMVAYSLTIHKAQSLTLERAILDLSDCFCEHMVYVALSRVKTLDGLYLESFNPSKIIVDKRMKEFLSKYE